MGSCYKNFALLMIIFWQCANSSAAVWNKTEARVPLKPDQKLLEIHKRLRALNKPAVKSIQSPDGDIIDCILRHKQIAFDDPLLGNHTIQEFPKLPSGLRLSSTANRTLKHPFQIWHLTEARCPKGTIPVRRTSAEDLMRFESPGLYGKKFYGFRNQVPVIEKPEPAGLEREYAAAYVTGDRYYGTTITTNVWNPKLDSREENSLAQLWLVNGKSTDPFLNTIEFGWQVHPPMYGDYRTRIFMYWTRDQYQNTGCYNLLCTGFIQTNNKVCIGGSVNTISSYEGTQYEELIYLWKDRMDGNWWLFLRSYGRVGFWPARIINRLSAYATTVQWGGEVVYFPDEEQHRAVQMGSGHFAREGFGRASYMRSLRVANESYNFRTVDRWYAYVTAPNCYSFSAQPNDIRRGRFYFGGPGRNSACP